MNSIIIYASKHGCTERCSNLLAERLNGNVKVVNVINAKSIDLTDYDKIIIGGSIYAGRIQSDIKAFCKNNMEILMNKMVGLFICGMQEGDSAREEIELNFPKELFDKALAIQCFGGEFAIDKMGFMEKVIVKQIAKVTESTSSISEEAIQEFAEAMNEV